MNFHLRRLTRQLSSSLWFIPACVVAFALALHFGVGLLDKALAEGASGWYLFTGGPESARAVLQTIAGSMMTFTGLVFSVTVLVLQQASTQFSPRALKTFLEDPISKLALGVFVGTFAYALMTLRNVSGSSESLDVEAFVPSLSIWLSVIFVLASLGMFILLIHHIAQSIRAVVVVDRIGNRARKGLEAVFPEGLGEDTEEPAAATPPGPPQLIVPNLDQAGVVVQLDERSLIEAVDDAEVFVRMVPLVGDFVPHGAPLFEVWGDAQRLDARRLQRAVALGRERSVAQDAAFGFRELVDVAERALSPSTNDPTTAVQAIDQLHDLLRRLCRRRFPSPIRETPRGRSALHLPRPDFDTYVRLAFDEIRLTGEGHLQIARRLRHMAEDLLKVAPPFRCRELERQLRLLDNALERGFHERHDRLSAGHGSPQGHGPL